MLNFNLYWFLVVATSLFPCKADFILFFTSPFCQTSCPKNLTVLPLKTILLVVIWPTHLYLSRYLFCFHSYNSYEGNQVPGTSQTVKSRFCASILLLHTVIRNIMTYQASARYGLWWHRVLKYYMSWDRYRRSNICWFFFSSLTKKETTELSGTSTLSIMYLGSGDFHFYPKIVNEKKRIPTSRSHLDYFLLSQRNQSYLTYSYQLSVRLITKPTTNEYSVTSH